MFRRQFSVPLVFVLLCWTAARADAQSVATPATALPRVTRAQALATAQTYLLHVWTPTARNTLHGLDPDGVRVDATRRYLEAVDLITGVPFVPDMAEPNARMRQNLAAAGLEA